MRTAILVFDEYPDDEIEVRLSPVAMADYLDIARRWDRSIVASEDDPLALFRRFGEIGVIERWTFPEPPDGEGMLARDLMLGTAIVSQWLVGVRSVPLPLPLGSSAGTPSTRETSPESSPEPS